MDAAAELSAAFALPVRQRGVLFVISGPSGSGKTTLCDGLRRTPADGTFAFSVSCTTRPPRPGESDGDDYHFLSEEEFARRVAAGDFLEHAMVHGRRYGTLRRTVLESLGRGMDVLLDVDIQGAAAIRRHPDPAVRAALADIFLMPPSFAELQRRLSRRATETAAEMEVRLRNAVGEMAHWREYRYAIVSGTPEEDLGRFLAVMTAERCRTSGLARAGDGGGS